MKSIIDLTGSEEFIRMKIGVGKKPDPRMNLADWVLSKFTEQELENLHSACENACTCLKLIINQKIEQAMNAYNA